MKINLATAITLSTAPFFGVIAHANTDLSPDFEIQGRVMVDYVAFDGIHNEGHEASEWLLRRARVAIKHKSSKDWKAELEIDIDSANEEADITDGYIAYEGWSWGDVAFGQMKENFGLEETTSSLNISTMERSLVTEVFAPGRNFGIQMTNDSNAHSWSLGMFQASEDEYGLDGYAYTGRLTFSPINEPAALLHLGVSASLRDMLGNNYEINEPLGISVGDSVVESPDIAADNVRQVSLEGAMVKGSFSLQGEWMQQQVKGQANSDDSKTSTNFSGYYVLASYFLTGESRVYDDGSFDETSPNGERGAWEIVTSYSTVDLENHALGAVAKIYLIGLNYYATGRAKLMLNLSRADNESSNPEETGEGNALSFRAQYEF